MFYNEPKEGIQGVSTKEVSPPGSVNINISFTKTLNTGHALTLHGLGSKIESSLHPQHED